MCFWLIHIFFHMDSLPPTNLNTNVILGDWKLSFPKGSQQALLGRGNRDRRRQRRIDICNNIKECGHLITSELAAGSCDTQYMQLMWSTHLSLWLYVYPGTECALQAAVTKRTHTFTGCLVNTHVACQDASSNSLSAPVGCSRWLMGWGQGGGWGVETTPVRILYPLRLQSH